MENITVPIYLISGFLESGKTSFLNFTLGQEYFAIDGRTLLILCEEGEEEYDEEMLEENNVAVEVLEDEADLTYERLMSMAVIHHPERVVVEYNGMWLTSKFREMKMPKGWGIDQEITCVDASTYQVYVNNMKSQFMDMVRGADMVIFNRCRKEDPLASFRRGIKVTNPAAEVIFEDEAGEIDDIFAEEMPFDLSASVVEILPEDYGIWYVDSLDHPEKYDGKTVRLKAKANIPPRRAGGNNSFALGRMAMTCCSDDMQFLGYLCVYEKTGSLRTGDWLDVTAKVSVESRREYGGEVGLVLYPTVVKKCEPLENDLVTFN